MDQSILLSDDNLLSHVMPRISGGGGFYMFPLSPVGYFNYCPSLLVLRFSPYPRSLVYSGASPHLLPSKVREEIRKEIKDFLVFKENVDTTFPNLWDTMKAVLRVNFIPLYSLVKKLE